MKKSLSYETHSSLLKTDSLSSAFPISDLTSRNNRAYQAFGYCYDFGIGRSGFANQAKEPFENNYLPGSGYRIYLPTLLRFNKADDYSPFEHGGLNAYAYCEGDPVNSVDPDGHVLKGILKTFTKVQKSKRIPFEEALKGPTATSKRLKFTIDGKVLDSVDNGNNIKNINRNKLIVKRMQGIERARQKIFDANLTKNSLREHRKISTYAMKGGVQNYILKPLPRSKELNSLKFGKGYTGLQTDNGKN